MTDNVDDKILELCEMIIQTSIDPFYVKAAKELKEQILKGTAFTFIELSTEVKDD